MRADFWNERYATDDYVYGRSPNHFFKEQIDSLEPGYLLTLAEGEGRNGVYAAELGWKVTAVDYSAEGRKKALELAGERDVQLTYHIKRVEEFAYPANHFDAVSLIYAHFPPDIRRQVHRKAMESLKDGGRLILEAFHKKQINRNTGGPKDTAMLYSLDELEQDFEEWQVEYSEALTAHIDEGQYHTGEADIVRMVVGKEKGKSIK